MWEDFKAFIMRGNVIDMAVGIIIGGAFGKIVSSFVNDIVMPPIGLLLAGVDFKDLYMKNPEVVEETEKECPFCKTKIAISATRCPHCTSQLNEPADATKPLTEVR